MMERAAASLLLAAALSACVPEPAPGEFVIVNRTDQPLFEMGSRLSPNGGKRFIGIDGCSGDSRLQLLDKQGSVFITLPEPYCEGQTWTVRGPDDYTLEPPPDE